MSFKSTPALDELNKKLATKSLRGQWIADAKLEAAVGGQKGAALPMAWRWHDIHEHLIDACTALPESFTARREIGGVNPGLTMGLTRNIAGGVQMVRPGEDAWAHRHSINAMRFVIQGDPEITTVVDGEVCSMEDYDLILTPNWSWHDHHNRSNKDALWLDVLDAPFIMGLDQTFYEMFGDERQPVRNSQAEYIGARAGQLRPAWEQRSAGRLPIRYAWKDIEPQLMAMASLDGSPYDGVALEYVNPFTGGATLPTLSVWIQMLRPGEETRPHRHTSSAIYFVVRGAGKTIIDGETFEWGQHDLIALPNWLEHQHINGSRSEEAILFSVNDSPIMEKFDLYREEPENTLRAQSPADVPGDVAFRARAASS